MKRVMLIVAVFVVVADAQTCAPANVITYEEFGAVGDGKTDDQKAIVAAHAAANAKGLPVRAGDGKTYYIGGGAKVAVIKTDVDFGTAKFVIDDRSLDNLKAPVFRVDPSERSFEVKGVKTLARGQASLGVSLLCPCLVEAVNGNVRQYIRYGLNQNNGTPQKEMFLVAADGTVDPTTPIVWDYAEVTRLTVYPVDVKTLTIKGGSFTTIANQAESTYNYHARGIAVRRSNVRIENLCHYVTGEGDHGAPYGGFVGISYCANVMVSNCVFTAHKTYRTIGAAGKPVSMGSYDISANNSVNVSFVNCRQTTDINDGRYWGIFGSNYCKNLLYDGCTFSRFDAHMGVANAIIRNSRLGHQGINAIGFGTFLVENTTVRSRSFFNLRSDYGSTWRGDFIVRNCTFVPSGGNMAASVLIHGISTDWHDFGYECYMPRRIVFDGFTIDDSKYPEKYDGPYVFSMFNPKNTSADYVEKYPYHVTEEVVLRNVTTKSGKPVNLSSNKWMFRNVKVVKDGVQRERLSEGWEFMRADGSASETNSAVWRAVRVPHDWGVEKSFDPKKPYGDAYLEPTGIGWYRRTFRLDPARAAFIKAGGLLFFESNGMMSHSKVWVNGKYVGGWPYGYTAFRCDLTPHLNLDGENTLVVRCHNHTDSSRWYTGGGMYRECRFAYCPADYLIPGSVAITTPEVTKERATVHVEWEMSQSGKKERTFTVESPRLWDIDDPHLYTIDVAGETFRYGIRTIAFYPDARGFQLNGRRVELKGVCLHHDLGVLGAAYNRVAMKRRFLKLKEAGVNAIRCSHNPEDSDFLDLCDELGLLVKDEVFDEWRRIGASGKRKDGYSKLFDKWHERDVRAWVRVDRNHPSVIMWSIGNEIPEGHPRIAPTSEFIRLAKMLDAIVKSEDRTRPTTNANNERANATNEYGQTLDIYGFNYSCYMFGPFKKKNPNKPFFGSETQCAIASRGAYTFPVTWGWTQQKTGALHVSGYGVEACGWSGDPKKGWACAPDAQWFNMDAHPECMGEFVWTGWDYLGGPYWADSMVKKFKIKGIHSCATGFIDLAGFPKDTFWLFQSRWRPDLPMAHIVPHWNWPDRVGKVTPVHVFTSGDEGELFLNGRSLGRQKKDPKNWKKAYRLTWDDVVYEPGTLKVVTYKNGAPWAEKTITTTGPAAQLKLEVEDNAEAGTDLVFVNLEVQDAEGRFVPDAAVDVTFSVKGSCELVATDNGDEADFASFHSPTRRTFSGRLQAIVRKKPNTSGTMEVTATSPGLSFVTVAEFR